MYKYFYSSFISSYYYCCYVGSIISNHGVDYIKLSLFISRQCIYTAMKAITHKQR